MQIKTESNLRYGILLSGGLDSAILLYLLIKSNPKIDIHPFTIPKTDGAALYANPVIEHFNSKFDLSIPKIILVGNPTVHHRYQSTTAVRTIFYRYPVDQLFIGINKNPIELENYPGAPVRDTKSDHPKITFPFVDMTKDQILKIMFDEGQEDLMSITHSCTERSDARCGTCWQCTERAWAFSKLGKTDIGTL
jgi:hypothetical protein